MTRAFIGIGAIACVLIGTEHAARAQPSSPSLTLGAVLRSAKLSHPKLGAARATIDEARGKRLAAGAIFDPTTRVGATSVVSGYYNYQVMDARVRQQVGVGGIDISAGYRIGRGGIPDYYGERLTRRGGEVYSNLRLPILAGRAIDSGRATLRISALEVRQTKHAQRVVWLTVARDATVAYWKWVAAGRKLVIARDLLRIASERAKRINERARRGALPRIVAVDTERIVLDRRSRVLSAQRAFARAQASLSLYYRDNNRQPVLAPESMLPASSAPAPALDSTRIDAWIDEAMRRRPEMSLLEAERAKARVERSLARNQSLPRLDLTGSVARDLGRGPDSLGQTDVAIGLRFELPLLRRKARGNERAANARLARLRAQRRGLRDRVAAEVRMLVRLEALARNRWRLAERRLVATRRLAVAERARLEQGASDMVTVNLREIAVASAADDAIDARLEMRKTRADLWLARGSTALDAP